MSRNIGTIDMTLRIMGGLLLIGLGAHGSLGWWGLAGFVPLTIGLLGTCPVYRLLGLNTHT